jgi:hypothetical protein
MSVDSGQARVSDLTYRVYARALHPEWFETKAFRRLSLAGWQADLRIVQGGHMLVWSAGSASLSEVLCTRGLELPETGLLHRSSVRHERSTSLGLNTRVAYHSCVEAERLEPEVFAHMNDELLLDASRGGLFHRARGTNRMVVPAIRLMKVETNRSYLSIHATHTFPEDLAIVRVESLIDLK